MENQEQTELDLKELAGILWKRIWLIALITLLAVATSGIVSYFVLTPQYEASAEILVNQDQPEGEFTRGDIDTNRELMNTYNVVMQSPRILDQVIEDYNLDMTYSELESIVNVQALDESQVMAVEVTHPEHEQAVFIANAVTETFQEEIPFIMNVDNVHIMAEAQLSENPSPVSPNPPLNMAIAFVVGLMTAVGIAFLLEYLDNTIKTEKDIEQELGLPIMGTIGLMDENQLSSSQGKAKHMGGEQIEA